MALIPPLRASSTKLAIFFSSLLIAALLLLTIEIISLTNGETIPAIFSKIVLALIIFICAGLFWVSFYVTRRINAIAETAEGIIATRDLSKRIPIDCPWDDITKVSHVLNAMLEEIEQQLNSVRQVADNIAHDLRTPLTRLRNHIDSMRSDLFASPTARELQQEQLSSLIAECDGILETFNALLRISNIESGRRHSGFHELNLDEVLNDVVELYEPVAAENAITITYESQPTSIVGDKDLLFQAVANLLDNAIKHSSSASAITLRVAPHGSGARVVLSDNGPGIADEHKPNVFRRFYRVCSSRNTPGSGLGLSLVAAIVKLHQGTITLTDNSPTGLIVTVTI